MPNAISVEVSRKALRVKLSDGRTIIVPVDRYPRLACATKQERSNWSIIGGGHGIHWEDIDEDVSVEGLLAGKPSRESASSVMNWLKARSQPRFCAWKGPSYGEGNQLGLPARFLILGESHYDRCGTLEDGHSPTKDVVCDYLQGGRHPFFTKLIHTILGPGTSEQKTPFFRSVAFYNYVQRSVGDAPGRRPTPDLWQAAAAPFLATVEDLRPTHILACGWDLWDNMPEFKPVWTQPSEKLIRWLKSVKSQRQEFPPTRPPKSLLGCYRHSRGQSFVLALPHPSRASGAWHRVVKRFLKYRVE